MRIRKLDMETEEEIELDYEIRSVRDLFHRMFGREEGEAHLASYGLAEAER